MRLIFCLLLLGLAVSSVAQDSAVTKRGGIWAGSFNTGYTNTNGNVDREQLKVASEIRYIRGRNQVIADGELIHAQNRGETIEQNLELNLMNALAVTKRTGLYGKATYYENEYRGFKSQWRLGFGGTYSFIDKPGRQLLSRLGVQGRETIVTGVRASDYNYGRHYFVLFGIMGRLPVVENVTFRTKVDYEVDMARTANYYLISSTAFELTVNTWLSTVISYRNEYSGIPIEGKKPYDTVFDVALSFRF
jgi:putative salt-induced outer membrane protein YdiY